MEITKELLQKMEADIGHGCQVSFVMNRYDTTIIATVIDPYTDQAMAYQQKVLTDELDAVIELSLIFSHFVGKSQQLFDQAFTQDTSVIADVLCAAPWTKPPMFHVKHKR